MPRSTVRQPRSSVTSDPLTATTSIWVEIEAAAPSCGRARLCSHEPPQDVEPLPRERSVHGAGDRTQVFDVDTAEKRSAEALERACHKPGRFTRSRRRAGAPFGGRWRCGHGGVYSARRPDRQRFFSIDRRTQGRASLRQSACALPGTGEIMHLRFRTERVSLPRCIRNRAHSAE